jgi:RNA recognition motif-containing protein
VQIVKHFKTGKSKGYAFVEFRHREDADNAMRADGRKIDGMRCIVDRELGRTNLDWTPRRLGGGKGEKRRNREEDDFVR